MQMLPHITHQSTGMSVWETALTSCTVPCAVLPNTRLKLTARLLFPSHRMDDESMLTDVRKMLDAIATRVGFAPREVKLYDFRHAYCAARLQTLDGDAPVSPYTVGQELGHGVPRAAAPRDEAS